MLFNTVSSNSTVSWVTRPIWPRRSRSRMSPSGMPSSRIVPPVGSAKRGTRLASVLLPQPLGPTMAIVSPKGMRRLMSSSTGWPGLIGETDAVEDQLAMVAVEGDRGRRVADRRLAVQPLVDAVAGRHGALQAAEDVGEFPHRIGHAGQQAVEHQQRVAVQRPRRTCGCPTARCAPRSTSQAPASSARQMVKMPSISVSGWERRVVAGDLHRLPEVGLAAVVEALRSCGSLVKALTILMPRKVSSRAL